jgi:hypothetical protein
LQKAFFGCFDSTAARASIRILHLIPYLA